MVDISDDKCLDSYQTLKSLRNRRLYLAEASDNFGIAAALDDRSAALICAETASAAVSEVLADRLALQKTDLPFSHLARIDLLKGILTGEAYKTLFKINEIRNTFAHAPSNITFDTRAIRDACATLSVFHDESDNWAYLHTLFPPPGQHHTAEDAYRSSLGTYIGEGHPDMPELLMVGEDNRIIVGFKLPKDGKPRSQFVIACATVTYGLLQILVRN